MSYSIIVAIGLTGPAVSECSAAERAMLLQELNTNLTHVGSILKYLAYLISLFRLLEFTRKPSEKIGNKDWPMFETMLFL